MDSTPHQSVLSFDIGLKRTGIASGHSLTKTANPAGQLHLNNGKFNWHELDTLLLKWEPELIVIGDPQTSDVRLIKTINRFKSYIQQTHKLPIIEVNERLSSSAANNELTEQGLSQKRKTKLRDQIAACLILDSYFHSLL